MLIPIIMPLHVKAVVETAIYSYSNAHSLFLSNRSWSLAGYIDIWVSISQLPAFRCIHVIRLWPIRYRWKPFASFLARLIKGSCLSSEDPVLGPLSFLYILACDTDVIMTGAPAAILGHEMMLYCNPYTRMMEQKGDRVLDGAVLPVLDR